MSTATSASRILQHLAFSRAKLFYKTAPENDWTLLDPLYPTPDHNIVQVIIHHGISMKVKFANGAGACTLRLDQEHYTVAGLKTVPHPSGSLTQSTIRLHLKLVPVPVCELSRTVVGHKDVHSLEDFPLHRLSPDFCEIKLDLRRLKLRVRCGLGSRRNGLKNI
ncbi:MAG: hypothetical protein Q9198_005755 [Flavoplaca austrocitrina]